MGKGGQSTGDALQQQQHPERDEAAPGVATGTPVDLLAQPQYQPFLAPGFSAAEFTSAALAGSRTTAAAQSEELRRGLSALEAELVAQVVARHRHLLGTARGVLAAEASLADVASGVDALQASVRRVRSEIEGPYEAVAAKAAQLRALHAAVELLRHLSSRLKLVAKLRAQLAAPVAAADPAKSAKLLSDIAAIAGEADLTGLAAADADNAFLAEARASVTAAAQAALAEGVESMSQAKVGSALQVFFNLGELQKAVWALMASQLAAVEQTWRAALDTRALGAMPASGGILGATPGAARGVGTSGSGAGGGAPGSWQDKLWTGLRAAAEQLVVSCTAVWHVQRVCTKKRDPLSHVLFLDDLAPPGGPLLTERFWADVIRVVGDACTSAGRPGKGGLVREALTSGYPRLALLLEGSFDKLAQDTTLKGVSPAVAPGQVLQLLKATGPFHDGFLSASLAHVSDGVNTALPAGGRTLPAPADVQKLIGLMHDELKGAGASAQLGAMAAGVVAKALRLLAERAEASAAAGPELRALGGAATPAQLRNIALCSQLQEVHRSLAALLPRLPPTASRALQPQLDSLAAVAVELVAPLFKAQAAEVEALLLGMHSLDWGGGGAGDGAGGAGAPPPATVATSVYMQRVRASISHFRSEYLSKFHPPPGPAAPSPVSSLAERMAGRTLSLFVRHAALLRPLGPAGQLALAKDAGELAQAVGQALFPLEALGGSARALRAFRAALFAEEAALLGSAALRDLPASVVLHHLFSRLPASIQAPHERSGLTPAQYSHWLDQHSADDVARSMKGALAAAAAAAAELQPPASTVYATMLQLAG